MGIKITGENKVLKDDRGIYRIALMNKELDKETGEEKSTFMKINVGFKKTLPELKHQSKIDIKDGFLTFFRVKTGEVDENGKELYRSYPKLIITDFTLLEEGTDEVQKTYQKQENKQNPNDYSSFVINNDDLPF